MRGSRFVRRSTAAAALAAAVALVLPTAASAEHGPPGNRFVEDNVVSDQPGAARITDPNLVNAWGLAALPTGPLWVADNGTSKSTIYPGLTGPAVSRAPLVVDTATDGPTGIVANTTSGFQVGGQPSLFVFDSEAGDITAWSPAVPPPPTSTMAQPAGHVDGAIFKGLAMLDAGHGAFLYAADFHHGRIDVFNDHFHQVPTPFFAFRDFFLPRGYAPFNVQALDGKLYVSYAKQDATAHDEVAGPGRGFVDVYSPGGVLLHRLVSRGFLNAPWGMAIAPKKFGHFGGDLLVGNFGDGRIHAYNAHNGHFDGTLLDEHGRSITIDGLWGLRFGNGVTGTPGTLIFSAGPDDESHGLVGFLTPSMS